MHKLRDAETIWQFHEQSNIYFAINNQLPIHSRPKRLEKPPKQRHKSLEKTWPTLTLHPIQRLPMMMTTSLPCTVVWNKQESGRKYLATRSSVRSFARTAHSFACSRLLAMLAPSAALTRSLARSLRSLPRSWESEFLMSQNDLVLSHSARENDDAEVVRKKGAVVERD